MTPVPSHGVVRYGGNKALWRIPICQWEGRGCFTNVWRALQNIPSKLVRHLFTKRKYVFEIDNIIELLPPEYSQYLTYRSPVRRQAITWTNAGLLLIGLMGTNFKSEFYHFHSRTWIWNYRLPRWQPFCPGGDELICSQVFPVPAATSNPLGPSDAYMRQ